ncbi:hypothetical protein SEMRO_2361_G324830.1 [Seminavis robusta]|uniref:Uncharacterized protein n=1 Tax=Seminavis robusta TaxID=568900 RepID=A0A9N8EXA6_9STRA|nr:hypothetical protein SEMRO_2361_G324830.1 [Seminavis robusta]|eukprot:Sro2361_g324830.1 n/a (228) ;mRNA; r:12254-12937
MNRDELVEKALEVSRAIPEWAETYLGREDCLVAVRMDEAEAILDQVKKQFDRRRNGIEQRYGRPEHKNDIDENTKRAVYLWQRIVENPANGKKPTQALAMLLAGFNKEQRKAGACFMKVSRAIKAFQRKQQTPPAAAAATTAVPQPAPAARTSWRAAPQQPPPPANNPRTTTRPPPLHPLHPVERVEFANSPRSTMSPISVLDPNATVVCFDEDDEEYSFFNTPPDF